LLTIDKSNFIYDVYFTFLVFSNLKKKLLTSDESYSEPQSI